MYTSGIPNSGPMIPSATACFAILVLLLGTTSCFAQYDEIIPKARHFNIPMAEILQQSIYLSTNDEGELVVKHASKGSDLAAGDYLSDADNIRLLNGGLDTFLQSGEKEIVVPVVDDEDVQHDGSRLLGFVKIQSIIPRRLTARRGEVDTIWDMDEGGPAPTMTIGNLVISGSGAKLTDDKDYIPIPEGGGKCITGRDCFNHNGTCITGQCVCDNARTGMTGTYCQLYRPDKTKIGEMMKFRAERLKAINTRKSNKEQSANRAMGIAASKLAQTKAFNDRIKAETITLQGDSTAGTNQAIHDSVSAVFDGGDSHKRQLASENENTQMTPEITEGNAVNNEATSTQPTDREKGSIGDSKPVKKKVRVKIKPKPKPSDSSTTGQDKEDEIDETDARQRFMRDRKAREREQQALRDAEEAAKKGELEREAVTRRKYDADKRAFEEELKNGATDQRSNRSGNTPKLEENVKELTVEDLYGPNKAYPEPYLAGNVPSEFIHARHKARAEKKYFTYSVKYRNGPLGITFDNTVSDKTCIERVGKGMQSDLSDVQAGDVVIAVDQYNVSNVPAKMTQRIMSSLGFPRNVVYEVPGQLVSKEELVRAEVKRQLEYSVVYPPSLSQDITMRLAEWSTSFDDQTYVKDYLFNVKDNPGNAGLPRSQYIENACPLYMLRGASDTFGCDVQDGEYNLPEQVMHIIRRKDGDLKEILPKADGSNDRLSKEDIQSIETNYPMLLMIAKEAAVRGVHFNLQVAAVAKRGICTFVQKTTLFSANGAKMGIVVNTEEGEKESAEMPKGKEATERARVPVAMSNFTDSALLHIHAGSPESIHTKAIPEIYGLRGGDRMSNSCRKIKSIIEDITDAWPHSVPRVAVNNILYPKGGENPTQPGNSLQSREPFAPRKSSEEGGRVAISGENGWAFFDYHLANFGPQTEDLPLYPMKLTMAQPPFGCDPAGYTARIAGSVVAILRGGGCSFGIKVINAQKLGATAVVIVNTDDAKTMRLMALPDEVPLINIPCLMVSRRVQFFLEAQLKRYYTINQHVMTIQPTGVFGLYEEKNDVALPERIEIKPPGKKK